MLSRVLVVIIMGIILGGCSILPKKSGIELMSYPTAKIYIDGKEAGMTPYKNNSLKPGMVEVRLSSGQLEWSKKVKLQNNANTVIDWEFGKDEGQSGGYVLFMEPTGDKKRAGLIVNAKPDQSAVHIEGLIKGYSPLRIDDIGEGDKQVTISFPGHKSINIFIKAVNGYQLVVDASLNKEESIKKVEEDLNNETNKIVAETKKTMVTILNTETGWLRVRELANSNSKEVQRVKPGETYEFLGEEKDWLKIKLSDQKSGWISSKYGAKDGE